MEAIVGTKESKDCSGRGLCDTDDRVCTCEPEYETSNGYNEEARLRLSYRLGVNCRSLEQYPNPPPTGSTMSFSNNVHTRYVSYHLTITRTPRCGLELLLRVHVFGF